jgi:DNA-binding CsgD family transcriptional regulator
MVILPGPFDLVEQAVAALRAEGKTYAEIGEALGISRQRAWQLGRAGALLLAVPRRGPREVDG